MRRRGIILICIVFGFMPAAAWAVARHGNLKSAAGAFSGWLWSSVGLFNHFVLSLSEPARLILMGLALIGLSLLVRRGIARKRDR